MATCPITGETTITRNYMRVTAPEANFNEFISFAVTRQQALDWILDNAPKDVQMRLVWNPYQDLSPDIGCICGWMGDHPRREELRAAPYGPGLGQPALKAGMEICPRCGRNIGDGLVVRHIPEGSSAEFILEAMADMRFSEG